MTKRRHFRCTLLAALLAMATGSLIAPISAAATDTSDELPLELPEFTGSQSLDDYLIAVDGDIVDLTVLTDPITAAGGTVTGRFDRLGTISARLTAEQADTLATYPDVESIEFDRPIDINADGAEAVPGRYIITLRRGTNPTARAGIVSALGDNVIATYRHAIDGYVVDLSAAELKAIKDVPGIATIEPDRVITLDQINDELTADSTQTGATWGLDRLDQVSLPLDGS